MLVIRIILEIVRFLWYTVAQSKQAITMVLLHDVVYCFPSEPH
mgnify:CR=1 FL=1